MLDCASFLPVELCPGFRRLIRLLRLSKPWVLALEDEIGRQFDWVQKTIFGGILIHPWAWQTQFLSANQLKAFLFLRTKRRVFPVLRMFQQFSIFLRFRLVLSNHDVGIVLFIEFKDLHHLILDRVRRYLREIVQDCLGMNISIRTARKSFLFK